MQEDNERRLAPRKPPRPCDRGYRVAYATMSKYAASAAARVPSFGRRPLQTSDLCVGVQQTIPTSHIRTADAETVPRTPRRRPCFALARKNRTMTFANHPMPCSQSFYANLLTSMAVRWRSSAAFGSEAADEEVLPKRLRIL